MHRMLVEVLPTESGVKRQSLEVQVKGQASTPLALREGTLVGSSRSSRWEAP